jgi:hypothetical protein
MQQLGYLASLPWWRDASSETDVGRHESAE